MNNTTGDLDIDEGFELMKEDAYHMLDLALQGRYGTYFNDCPERVKNTMKVITDIWEHDKEKTQNYDNYEDKFTKKLCDEINKSLFENCEEKGKKK